jgi:hypothetical protein
MRRTFNALSGLDNINPAAVNCRTTASLMVNTKNRLGAPAALAMALQAP